MKKFKLLIFCILILSACASAQVRSMQLLNEARDEHWGYDWHGVISLTTRAIELDPGNPWAYTLRGAANNALGEYRLSIKDQNLALDISPDYPPAFTNKALAFLRLGDLPIARMNMEEALLLDRRNLTVLVLGMEVYAASGNQELACQLLIEATQAGFSEFDMIEDRGVFMELVHNGCLSRAKEMIE